MISEYKLGKHEAEEIVGNLMIKAMQYNYIEMMDTYQDTDRASEGMHRLFGSMWDAAKENIWQWYDMEVTNEVG